jgi:hypothetical protein
MFGPYGRMLSDEFLHMFGTETQLKWPIPSELAERWRVTTLEQLVNMVGTEAITSRATKKKNIELENSIKIQRDWIADRITKPLRRLSVRVDSSTLTAIIDKAFALALKMFRQQCRFQVVFPKIGDRYIEGATPNLTSVPESDDVECGRVGFIVKPGLAKWGDAHGKSLEKRLDLVPSLVFIEATAKVSVEIALRVEAKSKGFGA